MDDSAPQQPSSADVTVLRLAPRDFIPNHPRLPVLLYSRAFRREGTDDLARVMETRFGRNGWPVQWRNGIYDFHHYHTEGHEVLGIAAGHATVMLGGEGGEVVEVRTGDVLLLPAGTGHCRLEASPELLVVGAYPPGQSGDIRREQPNPAILQRIARLTFPPVDPVFGRDGPLTRSWADRADPG